VRRLQDESLQFDTPEGVGSNIPVAVYVAGDVTNTVMYSYSPPVIQRLVVEQPPGASATTTLRMVGTNFGGLFDRLVSRRCIGD
jgi:hypothetical protein